VKGTPEIIKERIRLIIMRVTANCEILEGHSAKSSSGLQKGFGLMIGFI
jgi:hypothetical protein